MYYFIYAYESMYGGNHGLNSGEIISSISPKECNNMKYLNEYGGEMARDIVDDYGLASEYFDNIDNYDEDEINDGIEDNLCWEIYKVKNAFNNLSKQELENLADSMGYKLFIEKYCEPEPVC